MKFNGSINWAIDKAAGENNNSNQENVESEEDVDQDNRPGTKKRPSGIKSGNPITGALQIIMNKTDPIIRG